MSVFPEENEPRIEALLQQMSLDEKIGQLNQYALREEHTGPLGKKGQVAKRMKLVAEGKIGSVLNLTGAKAIREVQQIAVKQTRLGIPLLFAYDVIHGYETMFPVPLGESASWDLTAIEKSSRISAIEAAAAGLHWTFAPMVDVTRDARWGRVMEGAGEDPYLGTQVARARVRGFQGDNLADINALAACAKHFAGYGFSESGKDYNAVDLSRHTLQNVVLPPFRAALEAGVATFMNGFNTLGGVPVTADAYLQRDLLKGSWKFAGPVVSDWNSIGEIITHGAASDKMEAALLAMTAGSDIDMESDAYLDHLQSLVEDGSLDEKSIDDAVSRVLRLKFALGLFDDPYLRSSSEREKSIIGAARHHEHAREVARKSLVLLRNENDLLPLQKDQKIALIGPLAADKDTPLGNWRARAKSNSAISVQEGLSAYFDDDLDYSIGCQIVESSFDFAKKIEFAEEDKTHFAAALQIAREADIVVAVMGETANMSGEGRSRADIGLPGLQQELLREICQVNDRVVLVLMTGRPLALAWEAENIPAILLAWHAGSQAGHAITDVLMGAYCPSGKLPMSFPRSVGQLPMYYNHLSTGRPTAAPGLVFYQHHNDVDRRPLYPFGHGLSYTSFRFENLKLEKEEYYFGDSIRVTVELKNIGATKGEEVVQLYLQDLVAMPARPVLELKGFQKIELAQGESRIVSFQWETTDLGYWTAEGEWKIEAGMFRVFVGGSSEHLLESNFILNEKDEY